MRKLKKKRKWITETPIKQRTTDKKNDKVEYSHRQSKAEFFCENLTQAGTNYDVTENQHSVQSESDCEQTDCKNGRNLAQDLFGVRITNQTRKNSHQEAQRITANAKFTAKAKFSETSRNWKRLSKLTVRKTIEKLKRIKENLRDFDTILMDESIRSILEIYPDNSYGFISNEKELENQKLQGYISRLISYLDRNIQELMLTTPEGSPIREDHMDTGGSISSLESELESLELNEENLLKPWGEIPVDEKIESDEETQNNSDNDINSTSSRNCCRRNKTPNLDCSVCLDRVRDLYKQTRKMNEYLKSLNILTPERKAETNREINESQYALVNEVKVNSNIPNRVDIFHDDIQDSFVYHEDIKMDELFEQADIKHMMNIITNDLHPELLPKDENSEKQSSKIETDENSKIQENLNQITKGILIEEFTEDPGYSSEEDNLEVEKLWAECITKEVALVTEVSKDQDDNDHGIDQETMDNELTRLTLKDLYEMTSYDINEEVNQRTPQEIQKARILYRWHVRLGHRNYDTVKKLLNIKGKVSCTPCDTCLITKSTRDNRNRSPSKRAEEVNVRIHFDTQPLGTRSRNGFKYALIAVDDHTLFTTSALTRTKGAVSEAARSLIRDFERYHSKDVKIIRVDGGTEFNELCDWAKRSGIKIEKSSPYCQYQNGIVERHTRTILDTFRAMLYHSGLPKMFWQDAFLHAVYVHNVSLYGQDGKTPAERYLVHNTLNSLHDLKEIKAFGCLAYGHIYEEQRPNKKFSNRAFKGIYLGMALDYRSHQLWDPKHKKIRIVRDIKAVESYFPWKKKMELTGTGEEDSLIEFEDPLHQYNVTDNINNSQEEENFTFDNNYAEEYINVNEQSNQETLSNSLNLSLERKEIQINKARLEDMNDSYDPDQTMEEDNEEEFIFREQSVYDNAQWETYSSLDEDFLREAHRTEYTEALLTEANKRPSTSLLQKEVAYIASVLAEHDFEIYRKKDYAKQRQLLRNFRRDTILEGLGRDKNKIIECHNAISLNDQEPKNLKEAKLSEEWEHWDKAMTDEYCSLVSKGTWEVINKEELPKDRTPLRNMWIYKKKKNEKGEVIRFKARLVTKGYRQIPGQDFNETFASVAKFNTIRLIIALAAEHKWNLTQMDVKTAFLNGELEEDIYMLPPEGHESDKLLKLKKGLYGLKQAPRQWNKKLVQFLVHKLMFTQSESDECLFIYRKGKDLLIMAVYVDDLIMADNNPKLRKEIADALKKEYEMDDIGKLEWFLGIRVQYEEDGIWLKQDAYAETVAKRFNLTESKGTDIPSTPGMNLTKQDCPTTVKDKVEMSTVPYQSAVGSVLYAAGGTMVQIAAPVGQVCRFMHNPGKEHWKATKKIIKYLYSNRDRGLFYKYGNGSKPILVGYCDSDYNADPDERKSTTGYVFKLNGRTITWNSRKQSSTALSTSEAEYMALCEAAKEAVWLKRVLKELGFEQGTVKIYEDNQGAIAFTKNNVNHKRNKHIDVRYHYTRRLVEQEEIEVIYLPTEYMIADLLTKSPSKKQFVNLVDALCGTDMIENRVVSKSNTNTNE